jgi:anaerobic selenocysteine-containing dehydrogenase
MDNNKKISRRTILRGAVVTAAAVPVLLSGMTAAYAKVKQAEVKYQQTPKDGQKCSDCANFEAPKSCKLVDGEINPEGYCQLFKKKGS